MGSRKRIILDGYEIKTREQLFSSLKTQLDCEDFYGTNLDALYDVLTELPERPVVEIRNQEALCAHLGEYAGRLLRLLRNVEAEICRNVCLDTAPQTGYNKVSFDRERQDLTE